MKIRLLSDLHMEGFHYKYEWKGEDVLVLAGDIHSRCMHYQLISTIPDSVKIVIVAGNHEYYDNDFEHVNQKLFELQCDYPNVYWLDNKSVEIDGIPFYGGTMFTDFDLYGPSERWFSEHRARTGIADFMYIYKTKHGERKSWTVEDHKQQHELFKDGLKMFLKHTEGKKRVVVSHFVPSERCIHDRFKGSILNPYFTVNMEQYMGWDGLWLFGHTHDSYDLMIDSTRLVCNPRGYGDENSRGFNNDLIIEI